ncbi:hypothetical protein ACOME3_001611 [Neoechinorhynchus agilis]
MQNLVQIEKLSLDFFGGVGTSQPGTAASTNAQLEAFLNSSSCVNQSLELLQRAHSPYSIYLGGLALAKSYERATSSLSPTEIKDHKTKLLEALFGQEKIDLNIKNQLAKAYALLVQKFWFLKVDGQYIMRDTLDNMSQFDEIANVNQQNNYVVLLTNICTTLGTVSIKAENAIVKSSIILVSRDFRRQYMLSMLKLSTGLIRSFSDDLLMNEMSTNEKLSLVERSLFLCRECLVQDENKCSNENLTENINLTTFGGSVCEIYDEVYRRDTIRALFNIVVKACSLSETCLSVLALFASVRTTSRIPTEQELFISEFRTGVRNLLANFKHLIASQHFYYGLAQIIASSKCVEKPLISNETGETNDFVVQLAEFSIFGIQTMQSSSNNLLLALSIWKPLSRIYVNSQAKDGLSDIPRFVICVVQTFVDSRLNYIGLAARDGLIRRSHLGNASFWGFHF